MVAILDALENHSHMQSMRPQLQSHYIFGNLKNIYVAIQIFKTSYYTTISE